MKIENSIALVTGSNRGLGRSLVERLLALGAKKIYAAARDIKSLDGLFQDPRVVPVQLNVTDPRSIEEAAKRASDVQILFNNAGLLASFNVLTSTREQLQQDLNVNLFGLIETSKAFLPALQSASGAIVNVLTVVSLASMPGLGGYSASKAAAFSVTQALRGELKAKGIQVFNAYPGPIDTDMIRGFDLPKTSPEDVAKAILAGVSEGHEDIAPDPMSRGILAAWLKDPKAIESQFSKM
jgi:NAD(P)-dependent dehydrogenase (short-subunit alcohol dehydrogenase family)